MARWICPACDREFGRTRQSHVCVPGCTLDETFAGRPPEQRAAYDAVMAHLRTLGPIHDDTVRVGVFVKADRTLAELRPKARWLSLEIALPRRIDDPRITRVIPASGDRVINVVRLRSADDVDDQVRAWLTEAYSCAAG